MKNRLLILLEFAGAFLSACTKKTSSVPINEALDTTTAILKFQAFFQGGSYEQYGGRLWYTRRTESCSSKLSNFSTTNGPDLKVYLSKQVRPVNFIRLGDLKFTSGNEVYDII